MRRATAGHSVGSVRCQGSGNSLMQVKARCGGRRESQEGGRTEGTGHPLPLPEDGGDVDQDAGRQSPPRLGKGALSPPLGRGQGSSRNGMLREWLAKMERGGMLGKIVSEFFPKHFPK
jgi:hypothetical protein